MFHPLKDKNLFAYYCDINQNGVWWVEDMFSKHADTFSKKSEAFDLPNFQGFLLAPTRKITMMVANHFIKMCLSRKTDALQKRP